VFRDNQPLPLGGGCITGEEAILEMTQEILHSTLHTRIRDESVLLLLQDALSVDPSVRLAATGINNNSVFGRKVHQALI